MSRVPDSAVLGNQDLQNRMVPLPSHPSRDARNRSANTWRLVEIDETYLRRTRTGQRIYNGTENKEIVIGIRNATANCDSSTPRTPSPPRLHSLSARTSAKTWTLLSPTNGLPIPSAPGTRTDYDTRPSSIRAYVVRVGEVHTNTVESAFSLLKRGIMGTWHRVSVKHLPAYLRRNVLPVQ